MPGKSSASLAARAAAVAAEVIPADEFDAQLALATQDELGGAALVDKAALIGRDMIITRMVFRPSNMRRPGGGLAPEYVSVEAVTREDGKIVLNDGSTGIRRQSVQFMIKRGLFLPGEGFDVDGPLAEQIDSGALALSDDAGVHVDNAGQVVIDSYLLNPPARVRHGLRVSEYDHPEHGRSSTFYFA